MDGRATVRKDKQLTVILDGVYCETKNMSMGGLGCTSTRNIPCLTELDTTLKLPDGDVYFKSTALRCDEVFKGIFDVGIYFNSTSIDNETRRKIAVFLGVRLPDEEPKKEGETET